MNKPLEGLRIVDLTMGWAGPLATRSLADMGAQVIRLRAELPIRLVAQLGAADMDCR